jgi:hypothetical protein
MSVNDYIIMDYNLCFFSPRSSRSSRLMKTQGWGLIWLFDNYIIGIKVSFCWIVRGPRPAWRQTACGIRFLFPICVSRFVRNGSRLIGRSFCRRAICAGKLLGFSLLHPLLLVLCCGDEMADYLYTKYTPAGADLFVRELLTLGYLWPL